MTRVFICTDISALKKLGFNYTGTVWLYRTHGHYRITVEKTGVIRFMNHNKDTYSMFKKMIELGIIEETEITKHYSITPKNINSIQVFNNKDIIL